MDDISRAAIPQIVENYREFVKITGEVGLEIFKIHNSIKKLMVMVYSGFALSFITLLVILVIFLLKG